jgi:DNA polymerase III epsilon subunit-like protein
MSNPIEQLLNESIVIDTETTSLDFKKAEVIQYAGDRAMSIIERFATNGVENAVPAQFFTAENPITAETSSITTITNRMVEGSPKFTERLDVTESYINEFRYMIAHNAYYDEGVFKAHGMKLPKSICTMRFAKKLYKDDVNITKHNLSFLRYALDLPIPDDTPAHLADADVLVTTLLFARLIEDAIAAGELDDTSDLGEQITAWLDQPVIITIMPFGKHKGTKLVDVPISYYQWALENFNSLDEEDSAYDKDFAASITQAIEVILGD